MLLTSLQEDLVHYIRNRHHRHPCSHQIRRNKIHSGRKKVENSYLAHSVYNNKSTCRSINKKAVYPISGYLHWNLTDSAKFAEKSFHIFFTSSMTQSSDINSCRRIRHFYIFSLLNTHKRIKFLRLIRKRRRRRVWRRFQSYWNIVANFTIHLQKAPLQSNLILKY